MKRNKPPSEEKKKIGFFDIPKDWEKHWKGMPEFVQQKRNPYFHQFIVRFRTEEDMKEFAQLVDQELSKKTKSIWYPKIGRERISSKKYIHEDDELE